jgi:chitinase
MILKPVFLLISSLLATCTMAQAKSGVYNADPVFIGYWQNFKNSASDIRLTEIPEGYSIVNIAFATVDSSGTVVFNLQAPSYKGIVNGAALFKDDIKALQNRGIKVLLSLGGQDSFLHIDTTKKADEFVSSLEKIINDYGFDGIDYDLEGKLNNLASNYLLEVTRKISTDFSSKGSTLLFTVAPEAIDVHWQTSQGKYDRVIDSGLINFVSVQLYNSTCKRSLKSNSPCFTPGTQDFIVSQADSTIQTWKKRGMKEAESKYVIGLPATKQAANHGYVDPAIATKALNCLKTGAECSTYIPIQTYPNIGGVMTWSINWDAKNDYTFVDTLTE